MTLVAAQPRHLVTFYDTDETLALAAADFLGPGLAAGGRVVVVATPAHRHAIARALTRAGIDVAHAGRSDLYLEVDAAELMSEVVVDGLPDADRFAATIPALLEGTRAGGPPLRLYGEMVDLMWQAGNVRGAQETERLWNELGAGRDFAVFCGYASSCGGPDTPQRASIAAEHHGLVEAPAESSASGEVARRFEPTVSAPAASRRFVSQMLRDWNCHGIVADAQLLVSELATNAVLHIGGRFTVGLTRLPDGAVRIEVSDGSTVTPEARAGVPVDATNGRGIQIVSTVARSWGVHLRDTGKTVWAELAPFPE